MARNGTLVLDSIVKIRAFSNGEGVLEQSSGQYVHVGNFDDEIYPDIVSTVEQPNGSIGVRNKDLYNYYIDNKLVDANGPFESGRPIVSTEKVFIQELGVQNLAKYGRPCEKAMIEEWGKKQQIEYKTLVIDVVIDGDVIIGSTRVAIVGNFLESTGYTEQEERISEKTVESDKDNPLCPSPKKSIFYANDQDWGIVPLNTGVVKQVVLENRGDTNLVVSEYKPTSDKNFTILNLNVPIQIQPSSSISFDVQYNPLDEAETTHKLTVYYSVIEDGDPNKPVSIEKMISTLIGTGDKRDVIDDVIDDFGGSVLLTDDNGTYVNKNISKIVDKSVPIEKWKTLGLWGCVGERMYQFYTGSHGTTNDAHYLSVYSKEYNGGNENHQFDISFGHKTGLGSKLVVNNVDTKPSRTMYKKYLIECYEPAANTSKERPTKFKFKNDVNGDYVYFIQIDRDRFKHMLDPGNFELCLCPLSSSTNQLINTGSNVKVDQTNSTIYTLIDESWDAKQAQSDSRNLKDWYYIVSGSKRDGVYSEEEDNAWGVVFPSTGLIVLDGAVLDQSCSFNTVTASIDGQNVQKLFLSISGSSSTTLARNYSGSFFARSAERSVVETYFCRINGHEFNYSNNPTYVSGSGNKVKYEYFGTNPTSYITSIGLYNKKGDLLAVGKLKKPIVKNEHKSYVFQVRVRLS